MSHSEPDQRQVDAMGRDLQFASAVRTVGWTLLLFDVLVAIWVWVGFRAGSYFWLYWTVIEAVLGIVLVLVGSHLRDRAGRHLSEVHPGGSRAA